MKKLALITLLSLTVAAAQTAKGGDFKAGTSFSITGTAQDKTEVKHDLKLDSDGAVSDADDSMWEYLVVSKNGRNQFLEQSHGGKLLAYIDYPANGSTDPTTVCIAQIADKNWKSVDGVLLRGDAADLLDLVNIADMGQFDLKGYGKLAASQSVCTISRS